MPQLRSLLAVAAVVSVPAASHAADDPKAVEFFEAKIRPVLVEQCYKCHSEQAEKEKKLRGGLKLDTKANWLKGGDTGPAIVPGKPTEGSLLASLKYGGDTQMPPKGKLPDGVITDFEKWIKDGAADPRTGTTAAAAGIDIEKGRQFWAFRKPVLPAIPQTPNTKLQIRTPIDAFVFAKWGEHNITPATLADRRTLLRRAYFDLIGLPPTPAEMNAFLADTSPDAYEKAIDRLLASPHYGERWARHWLDVARYAEDQAHTFAVRLKTNAYLYRDWVIKAFNDDMPYDRFVRLQIAGDLVSKEGDDFTRMAGLGYMGLGAEYYKNSAKDQAVAEELDDRVDTLTRGFLGLTVSCARCHDHKFDPIPTKDYYALAGVFNGTNLTDFPLAPAEEVKAFTAAQAKMKAAQDKLTKAQNEAKAKPADKELAAAAKEQQAEVERLKKEMPAQPLAAHVLSGNGTGMKVYIRGNPATRGDDAPKGFLQVLSQPGAKCGDGYTRLDLANDIASRDNPLTARVFVNRVWQEHFGRGLVSTPSNFGSLGDRPSHPELLDWLAVEFMTHGWSVKRLHRQIMLSSTYRLASATKPLAASQTDAANVYLWRATRRRLDVEAWRDSLLFVSGNLDETMGGPTFNLRDANAKRRTVYAKVSRHELDGLLRLFDFPDANVTADHRTVTTVPQQQLFALNSDFMVNQAKALAARVERTANTDDDRVATAYRLCYQRPPDAREAELARAFLRLAPRPDDKLTRWQQYCQVLLASSEMLYVD
ncbi:MAG: PSD1 and planctomycete cytochrome C domain-containing protein [Gemmataceae bacterium]|nr:PSD1 and planctomycete cytochrome C domain-containing protein [Gemmataceae bacterium]